MFANQKVPFIEGCHNHLDAGVCLFKHIDFFNLEKKIALHKEKKNLNLFLIKQKFYTNNKFIYLISFWTQNDFLRTIICICLKTKFCENLQKKTTKNYCVKQKLQQK